MTTDGQEFMLPPEQFAALVAQASDEQLEEGLAANREQILSEIFRNMPGRLDSGRTSDVDAMIEWRIREGPGGGPDRYQVAIRRGSCTIERDGSAEPDVTFELGALDFVRLVAGDAGGPALFVFGKLKIRGNLMLAARVQGFFRIPQPEG
jgi:putative sterol carrier protein